MSSLLPSMPAVEADAEPEALISRAVIRAVEGEQRQVGQALHDTLCQSLSGVQLLSRLLARRLTAESPAPHPPELTELEEAIRQCVAEVHHLNQWLRPREFGTAALAEELGHLAELVSARTPCAFDPGALGEIDDPDVTRAFSQVARQLLRFAVTEQRPTRAAICVVSRDTVHELAITIVGVDDFLVQSPAGRTVWELLSHYACCHGGTLRKAHTAVSDTRTLVVRFELSTYGCQP